MTSRARNQKNTSWRLDSSQVDVHSWQTKPGTIRKRKTWDGQSNFSVYLMALKMVPANQATMPQKMDRNDGMTPKNMSVIPCLHTLQRSYIGILVHVAGSRAWHLFNCSCLDKAQGLQEWPRSDHKWLHNYNEKPRETQSKTKKVGTCEPPKVGNGL